MSSGVLHREYVTNDNYKLIIYTWYNFYIYGRGRDRMAVGYTTSCAISAYHH
jgi:hypothetical protein